MNVVRSRIFKLCYNHCFEEEGFSQEHYTQPSSLSHVKMKYACTYSSVEKKSLNTVFQEPKEESHLRSQKCMLWYKMIHQSFLTQSGPQTRISVGFYSQMGCASQNTVGRLCCPRLPSLSHRHEKARFPSPVLYPRTQIKASALFEYHLK